MTKSKFIRSFGRIKSRKLSDNKNHLYSNLLPKYSLEINQDSREKITRPEIFNGKFKEVRLEIGFGFGDFIFETAKNNPEIGFVASEIHINGIINLLSKLEEEPLDNIKIYSSDVRLLLERLEDGIFDQVYILFPDPWPKLKHHKRRLINEEFLGIIHGKIVPGSKLVIATDHDSYKRWIMSKMICVNFFKWIASSKHDWQNFPDDWVYSKYQKKAAREGRVSIYLEFEC